MISLKICFYTKNLDDQIISFQLLRIVVVVPGAERTRGRAYIPGAERTRAQSVQSVPGAERTRGRAYQALAERTRGRAYQGQSVP